MTHRVDIRHFNFVPATVTIFVGDSVEWKNFDGMAHSAFRTEEPAFRTGPLDRNQISAPQEFNQESPAEGFLYRCDPHLTMIGHIIVLPHEESGDAADAQR